MNYSCIAKDIKPIKSIIPKLSAGNELKLQLKKEKKFNENNGNINADNTNSEKTFVEDKTSNNFISNENRNNVDQNKNEKLTDSLTLNLNELFNSNFDENEGEMKTEFTRTPEANSSTKDEIAKIIFRFFE